MAMGAADVVPGVSGGTIAFITGIYEELIGSISALDKEALSLLFKGKIGPLWTKINGNFLVVLFTGIFTSILSLASVFTYALEFYEIFTWSFFFGLVIASVWIVGKSIEKWNIKAVLAYIVGTIIAYIITELSAVNGIDAPWYFVLSGALAVCAMILPGISGSFILLLLGAYSTILEAVANREITTIALVGIGAITGLLLFSKGLKFIFERFYVTTVALLCGFLLGSLNKLWPWKEVIETFTKNEGTPKEEIIPLTVRNLPPDSNWPIALLCAIFGAVTVIGIEYAGKKLK